MSQNQQLTKEMHDLIKSIGETRSKQEEDKIILAEQAKLKLTIKDQSLNAKKQKENLIKAIYIEMLGHDASFAHFNAVQMAQSKSLQMKRLGYLTCCLFLNEQSEFLILLVANLQKDLQSKSIHEIVIALTALAKLMNKTILQGVLDQVVKLLIHHTDLVRKKAIMVLQRIHAIQPESIPDYDDKMRRALCDVEPSVMSASLNLYTEAVKGDPQKYKDTANSFVLILKQVIEHKLPRDFDYARIPAPWIQIKILQILSILGKKDQKVSEQIYEILGQALRRSDDSGSKIGFAVTYQCVKTIATIYPYESLLEQAAAAVSRFLTAENNNLKYLGINALISIVQVNASYVLDHQLIVMDCLESNDDTLKRETLELLYKMTNIQNVQPIVERLVVFLKTNADPLFRKNLVNKITSLAERHSPSHEWFVKTMNLVFEYGSENVSSDILNTFLRTLAENFASVGGSFGEYLINTYLPILSKPSISDVTYQLISWVFGEIGAATYGNNQEQLHKIVEALLECITNDFEEPNTRGWILNALAKLSSCPAFSLQEQVAGCLDYYSESRTLEVADRAIEYKILSKYNAALRQSNVLKVDPKLSFLDSFIEKAVQNGAPRYDSSKLTQAVLGNTSKNEGLKFDAYEANRLNANRQSNKEETLNTINKNNIWGENGHIEIDQPSKTIATREVEKSTKSISSNEYQGNNNITSNNNEPYIPGVQVNKNTNSISSSNVKDLEGLTTVPIASSYKPRQEAEDPKKKQLELMAKSIFGNVSNNPPAQPVNYSKPASSYPVTAAIQPKQTVPSYTQPKGVVNLLDDDFDAPKPVSSSLLFSSFNITVEQYENYWQTLKNEVNQEVVSGQIKNEYQFRNMLSALGIGVIEVDGNELICAGKNIQTANILLFYGSYSATGNLSITVKSNSSAEIDQVFKEIRNRFL